MGATFGATVVQFHCSSVIAILPSANAVIQTTNRSRHSAKIFAAIDDVLTLSEPFDVVKTFTYRPEYFGKHFCDLGHDLLRGPSEWTIGERELFGAFTASLNHCLF